MRWLLEDALGKVKALQEAASTLKLLPHWQRMSLGREHPVASLQASIKSVVCVQCHCFLPQDVMRRTLLLLVLAACCLPGRTGRRSPAVPARPEYATGSVGKMREGAFMLGGHTSRCHQDMQAAASRPLTARQQVKEETGNQRCSAPTFRKRPWSNNK